MDAAARASSIHQALIYRPLHLLQVWWGCSATKSLLPLCTELYGVLSLSLSLAPARLATVNSLALYRIPLQSYPVCLVQRNPTLTQGPATMACAPPTTLYHLHYMNRGTITGLNRCHTSGELKPSPLSSSVCYFLPCLPRCPTHLPFSLRPCLWPAERLRQDAETQKPIAFWPIATPHQAPRMASPVPSRPSQYHAHHCT